MSVGLPVFIFPNFAKGEPEPEILLQRLNEYGRAFFSSSQPSKLLILIGISTEKWDKIDQDRFEFLEVHRISNPSYNFLAFSCRSFLSLRNTGFNPKILISGDIYYGFLSSILIKKLWLRKNIPIQISVHGYYLESPVNKKFAPPFLLKFYILKVYAIADSIRVVSEQLKSNLITNHGISSTKIFVAPIPLRLQEIPKNTFRKNDVLFVGRFHPERGIDLLMKICRQILSDSNGANLVLVGDGPLRHDAERMLGESAKLSFRGYVSPQILSGLMLDSKIVLSTAPLEGYGLAIREALISGCFVVARRNEVTINLNRDFPSLISLFDTEHEAVEIISKLLTQSLEDRETVRFRELILISNKLSLQLLTDSWSKF